MSKYAADSGIYFSPIQQCPQTTGNPWVPPCSLQKMASILSRFLRKTSSSRGEIRAGSLIHRKAEIQKTNTAAMCSGRPCGLGPKIPALSKRQAAGRAFFSFATALPRIFYRPIMISGRSRQCWAMPMWEGRWSILIAYQAKQPKRQKARWISDF